MLSIISIITVTYRLVGQSRPTIPPLCNSSSIVIVIVIVFPSIHLPVCLNYCEPVCPLVSASVARDIYNYAYPRLLIFISPLFILHSLSHSSVVPCCRLSPLSPQVIKSSRSPIICICNDRQAQKIRYTPHCTVRTYICRRVS